MSALPLRRAGRGSWIPWLLLGLFGVVVAVNGVMVWLAVTTFPGLLTARPNERGLDYNRHLAAAAAQDHLGWRVELSAEAQPDGTAELVLVAADRDGRPLTDALVEGRLERPARADLDLDVVLDPAAPGRYRVRVRAPAPGVWDAHLRLTRGTERLVIGRRLLLP